MEGHFGRTNFNKTRLPSLLNKKSFFQQKIISSVTFPTVIWPLVTSAKFPNCPVIRILMIPVSRLSFYSLGVYTRKYIHTNSQQYIYYTISLSLSLSLSAMLLISEIVIVYIQHYFSLFQTHLKSNPFHSSGTLNINNISHRKALIL